jgi:hypothetical protein
MMLRNSLVFIIGLALVGCGSSGPSIAGKWVSSLKGSPLILEARPDSSFTMSGPPRVLADFSGRWEVSGNDVKLFEDVRNGGGPGFGDGGDGAFHFKLSSDGKRIEGKGADGSVLTFTKQ